MKRFEEVKMLLKSKFLALVGLALSQSVVAQDLVVFDAWVRATPPGKMMTAAYGELTNTSNRTLVVTGVQTEAAAHSSFHETLIERDISTMRPVKQLTLDPGQSVALSPGQLHIMLMKLSAPLNEGETIDICLKLENNEQVCDEFPVAKYR